MIYPARVALTALRHSQFDFRVGITGISLNGAGLAMQVRLYPDAAGDPLLSLTNAAPPANGLSVTVAAVNDVPRSEIRIIIDRLTINSVLAAALPTDGKPIRLAYDLVTTGINFDAARLLEGEFFIKPGVTKYG